MALKVLAQANHKRNHRVGAWYVCNNNLNAACVGYSTEDGIIFYKQFGSQFCFFIYRESSYVYGYNGNSKILVNGVKPLYDGMKGNTTPGGCWVYVSTGSNTKLRTDNS